MLPELIHLTCRGGGGGERKTIHNLGESRGGGNNVHLEFRGRGMRYKYSELGLMGVVKKQKESSEFGIERGGNGQNFFQADEEARKQFRIWRKGWG